MGTWSKTSPGDILLWSAEVDGEQVLMYKENRYGYYYHSRISCAPQALSAARAESISLDASLI